MFGNSIGSNVANNPLSLPSTQSGVATAAGRGALPLAFVAPSVGRGGVSTQQLDRLNELKNKVSVAPSVPSNRFNVIHGSQGGSGSLRAPANPRLDSTALQGKPFDPEEFFNKLMNKSIPPEVSFDDVAGVDEAKYELEEVVAFLKNPEKFQKMGARIPKGVLLAGPPGTGKTLLAKAVAGEAGVPFHTATGSGFVEMFVGRGAARVRDLFKKAAKDSPCIIFIDEIDAVGKQRGAGFDGGNDERAQTLNQLLTEMDGFNSDSNVVVIAATNRIDVLDEALVRPGRFDRHVPVSLPDRGGREAILKVHARNKIVAENVDFTEIARRTPGFSGADLANLMNEAAILAVRNDQTEITTETINAAIDRVLAGPEKINAYISEERKRLVAYHEAGHALVGSMLPEFDTVEKVTIVPRGNAAGLTWFTPPEQVLDSGLYTYGYLKNQIAVALGGRIAEELIFGIDGVTSGASNDLQKVTAIARQVVKGFAMGNTIPMNLDTHTESAFVRSYSDEVARRIDQEVEALVMEAYEKASRIIVENRDSLDELAERLIEEETIEGPDVRALIANNRAHHADHVDAADVSGAPVVPENGKASGGDKKVKDNPIEELVEKIKQALDPWTYLK